MIDDLPANPTAAPLIIGQRETNRLLDEIRDALTRREEPAPGLFHIFPQALQTKIRIRAQDVAITATAIGTVALKTGDLTVATLRTSDGTASYSLPITFDRGVTVQLIDPATGLAPAAVLDAWIIGYPDYAESDSGQKSALHERIR